MIHIPPYKHLGVIIALLTSLILTGCTESEPALQGEIDFSFTTLDEQQEYLHDYYGKIILLDLMGVNCQPCQLQMFELKKIRDNYSTNEVTILSINVWISLGETDDLTQQLIDAYKNQANIELNWTFGVDDTSGTIQKQYAQNGVPTLYIIDTKGNIYYTHFGFMEYQTLATKINELLT